MPCAWHDTPCISAGPHYAEVASTVSAASGALGHADTRHVYISRQVQCGKAVRDGGRDARGASDGCVGRHDQDGACGRLAESVAWLAADAGDDHSFAGDLHVVLRCFPQVDPVDRGARTELARVPNALVARARLSLRHAL